MLERRAVTSHFNAPFGVFVCVANAHAHVNVQCVYVCLQGAYSTSLLASCHLCFHSVECNSMQQVTDFLPLKSGPQHLTPDLQ